VKRNKNKAPARLIDVPGEMSAAAVSIGGEDLDKMLPTVRPFLNADYRFAADGVIAELKSIETEVARDERFLDKSDALHAEWLRARRYSLTSRPVRADGTIEVSTSELPQDCVNQLVALVAQRLRELFKKASKQINATREQFGPPHARGLLLLCVDQDTGLSLEMIHAATSRLVLWPESQYSGIESIVLFSGNYAIEVPGHPAVRPWMFTTGKDRPLVPLAFARKLGAAWQARIAAIGGPPVLLLDESAWPVLAGSELSQPHFERVFCENFRPVRQDELIPGTGACDA
jgi:hypothetical protein